MINLILFGPPGAGKGTQSEKIIAKYGFVHVSTGDIFRANMKNGTELGNLAKSYMDKGVLVPDEVTIGMLESEYAKHSNAKGFIFDGFPRTTAQAEALDKMLASKNTSVTKMLALEVNDDELLKRLLERGKISGRADDADENVIRNRIAEYNNKTAPLKDYYSKQGKFSSINGIGSIDEIFDRISKQIG